MAWHPAALQPKRYAELIRRHAAFDALYCLYLRKTHPYNSLYTSQSSLYATGCSAVFWILLNLKVSKELFCASSEGEEAVHRCIVQLYMAMLWSSGVFCYDQALKTSRAGRAGARASRNLDELWHINDISMTLIMTDCDESSIEATVCFE